MGETTYSTEFASLQRVVAGRYSLVRQIGRGGMGIVFLARDVALDRPVAIKLLPLELARDPAFRERFLQEARMAASLAHPHIVPIHSVEAHDDVVFFVMSYVEGESLGERIRRRGTSGATETARITQEVAWALAHAHARGIVHRDVKPDNILIDRESGRVMVTDFGIARVVTSEPSGAPAGTPHYLSPEQMRGEPGDARSDIYALGVTAWHVLTGKYPFEAASLSTLLVRQSSERAPSLATAAHGLPARLVAAVDRCLARMPAERWPSAEELAVELNGIRARSGELPGPVRSWMREVIPAGNDIGLGFGGVLASVSLWVITMMVVVGGDAFATTSGGQLIGIGLDDVVIGVVLTIAALLFGGLALGRLGSVVAMTRDLVEAGYSHDMARLALVEADAEAAGEKAAVSRRDRRRRALVSGVGGAAATSILIGWASLSWSSYPLATAMVLSVLILMITGKTVLAQLSEGPSWWSLRLRGGFGRALFRVAGWFTRRGRAHAPAAQPTIAALGVEAEALFRALPPEVRDQLHDLPEILAQLRAKAERLHMAERHAEASPEQVADVVAAMEAVRLELMGMGAGVRSVPDVTRNLEDARCLAERMDAVLRLPARGLGDAPELESTG